MRVFIGVELPEHVREACALLAHDFQSCVQGKWMPRENWHITLAFIGETETARLDELARIMTDAAARFAPPRLSLDAPGVFEKRGGGILYAGVRSDAPLEPLRDAQGILRYTPVRRCAWSGPCMHA